MAIKTLLQTIKHGAIATKNPLNPAQDFQALSLLDVLKARDLYHLHLAERKGVIGTAVGRYLIRREDSMPDRDGIVKHKGSGPKRLDNTEIRTYSWPCVIAFVEKWIDKTDFGSKSHGNEDYIPNRLNMPDGKIVPVCVIEAPPDLKAPEMPVRPRLPKNFLGGGYPVYTNVQGEEHVASIGCLVTDGHLTYAVTNRHVAGNAGEEVYSILEGHRIPIGVSSSKQIGRVAFCDVYQDWPGTNVLLNADIGLIEIEDKTRWTPQIYSMGVAGDLADFSTQNLSLDLVNCDVRAYGCASQEMYGRIWALFYRYKSVGGFEYVTDLLIGPQPHRPFKTQHGDSGTLWLLEPPPPVKAEVGQVQAPRRPIAIQWGGFVFTDSAGQLRQPYALATLLSTVCQRLEVDFVRDWGLSLPEYWGTVGHFTIANMACQIVSTSGSKLRTLINANLENITIALSGITVAGTQGLSKGEFVPLADVPDLVWKMPSGTGSRGPRGHNPESTNHFADMDEPPPDKTPTLLDLCKDPANVTPDIWISYARKFIGQPGKSADPAADMGLLPFRAWQIYDAMVGFVKAGQKDEFICAAGTLAHYIGDACQPLHISFLHHGFPNPTNPKSANVHEDYEQTMFRGAQGEQMKTNLQALLAKSKSNGTPVVGGHAAAVATVQMMTDTFNTIHPSDICTTYDTALASNTPKGQILSLLWDTFGDDTVKVMADGCKHLALLWESAWIEGGGDKTMKDLTASTHDGLKTLYNKKTFLPSFLLTQIGAQLQGVAAPAGPAAPVKKPRPRKTKK